MAREREIKIRLKDISLDEFVNRVEKSGFKLESIITQTDIYFDRRDWYLYDNLAALRLRKVNDKDDSVSFKKLFYLPNRTDKHFIEEIETRFPPEKEKMDEIIQRLRLKGKVDLRNGDTISEYFRMNGYFDEQKMSKIRKVYINGYDEIVIDDVDRVGLIIEIECREGEPIDIANKLLTDREWVRDLEGTSYIWLRNVKGLNRHLKHLKCFETDPTWNVWDNERDFYQSIQSSS